MICPVVGRNNAKLKWVVHAQQCNGRRIAAALRAADIEIGNCVARNNNECVVAEILSAIFWRRRSSSVSSTT